ncbi:F0F1 ATP synthase subunit B family protein [Blastomonas fulva]|uniref:F0F1 ATP synthase subunit B family protein n=1 Tax=Blastomonas fulva TaxID=1550728 RepID=UPI0025A3F8AC|nr:ATPase [Blastomonas fulva]MDM7928989.1 ATPase [Blastomonas fulva]MDM7965820.1 ATPase [Blastomonas fulva]
MPQIDQIMSTYGSQFFWLVITFGLIYFVIGRSMLPKIQGTVDLRKGKIASDIAAAKAAHARADEIEEDYRQAHARARDAAMAVTAEAKAKGIREAEAKVREADVGIAAHLADAEAAIAAQQASALSEIEAVAVEAAQDIVARLTPAKITKPQVNRAVKGALADA